MAQSKAGHRTPKDIVMNTAIAKTLHLLSALILIGGLGLGTGCGDSRVFQLNPGHIPPDSSTEALACFDGAEVRLLRYSSRCARSSGMALVAEIGDGLEFTSKDVSQLEAPCSDEPTPGLEVHVDRASLIFDFSPIAKGGRFPRADFEGFVIDVVSEPHNSLLVAATVDTEESTIELDNADIAYGPKHIEVNFEGASYDDRDFVKIDLWFASAVLLNTEGQ